MKEFHVGLAYRKAPSLRYPKEIFYRCILSEESSVPNTYWYVFWSDETKSPFMFYSSDRSQVAKMTYVPSIYDKSQEPEDDSL